ncbi:uncharacterized protein [Haliotis cracherodii]|uniref:uncharacterized protein n=1 Tax=Haliotis cracherodii TaxID=6455 RepID=UPI0039E73E46
MSEDGRERVTVSRVAQSVDHVARATRMSLTMFLSTLFITLLAEHTAAVSIPLEQVADSNNVPECRYRQRSGAATNKASVWLFEGESVSFQICLLSPDDVIIHDLVYSNDGGSDVISIAIDSDVIGTVNTSDQSGNGFLWNVFRHSGYVGQGGYSEGRHLLSITVTDSDEYGVELDTIVFGIGALTEWTFCGASPSEEFVATTDKCPPEVSRQVSGV